MKDDLNSFYDGLISNIVRMANEKNIKQATLAEHAGISQSQMSKVLKGDVSLSIRQLSSIANALDVEVIDIITYPVKYVPSDTVQAEPVKAVLQIELSNKQKDQIFKLVLNDNITKILNE